MSETSTKSTKLAPYVYDAKGAYGKSSYVCPVTVVETVTMTDDHVMVHGCRVQHGEPVYANDRPALFALIRAHEAIVELIEVEIAEHGRKRGKR